MVRIVAFVPCLITQKKQVALLGSEGRIVIDTGTRRQMTVCPQWSSLAMRLGSLYNLN